MEGQDFQEPDRHDVEHLTELRLPQSMSDIRTACAPATTYEASENQDQDAPQGGAGAAAYFGTFSPNTVAKR